MKMWSCVVRCAVFLWEMQHRGFLPWLTSRMCRRRAMRWKTIQMWPSWRAMCLLKAPRWRWNDLKRRWLCSDHCLFFFWQGGKRIRAMSKSPCLSMSSMLYAGVSYHLLWHLGLWFKIPHDLVRHVWWVWLRPAQSVRKGTEGVWSLGNL